MLCGRRGVKAAFHPGRSLTREQKRQLGFMRGRTPWHAMLTETLRVLDAGGCRHPGRGRDGG